MEEIKEEKKNSKKTIIFLILSLMSVIMIILIIAVLSNIPGQKKTKADLSFESNPSMQEGVLGNLNPFAKDADVSQEITPVDTKTGGSSSQGGGGSASSPVISSSSSGNKNFSSKGSLEINNIINRNYTSSNLGLAHYSGANESLDNFDSRYYAMFDPSGIASKIISKNGDYELDADIRPIESSSDFYLELSLVSQGKGDITINSFNELRISLPLEGYEFKDKTLTLQQYDPENPAAAYPQYNLKDKIAQGNGVFILTLNNLSGTYKSDEPYAYFRITFS